MSVRTIVVAHRETLAAEGIAAALGRYPALAIVGIATTAAEAERHGRQADAVAIDSRIPGASSVIGRLRKQGIRVVVIGDARSDADGDGGSPWRSGRRSRSSRVPSPPGPTRGRPDFRVSRGGRGRYSVSQRRGWCASRSPERWTSAPRPSSSTRPVRSGGSACRTRPPPWHCWQKEAMAEMEPMHMEPMHTEPIHYVRRCVDVGW